LTIEEDTAVEPIPSSDREAVRNTDPLFDVEAVPEVDVISDGQTLPDAEPVELPEPAPAPAIEEEALIDGPTVPVDLADDELAADAPSGAGIVQAAPSLVVEIAGPGQTSVGTAAGFTIYIKNMGTVTADGVSVQAVIPQYVDVLRAAPAASLQKANRLTFALGDLEAEAVRKIDLELIPRLAGEVRLHTSVGFSVAASSTVRVGKPKLKLRCEAPALATLGDLVTFRLVVENLGDALSRAVTVTPQVAVPGEDAMTTAGRFDVGPLQPGDSKEILLRAMANRQGPMQVRFVATDDSGDEATTDTRVRVQPSSLNVTLIASGRTRVGVEQEYQIRVTNTETAATGHVRISCTLPADLHPTVVDSEVVFETDSRLMVWTIDDLPAGDTRILRFKGRLGSVGEHTLRATIEGDGLSRPQSAETTIEAYDEPQFQRTASR
jgi:uncharacterized repeat protein (TIGR01451 family)